MHVGILVFDGADELGIIGPFRVFHAANEAGAYVQNPPHLQIHVVGEHDAGIRLAHGLEIKPTDTYEGCPRLDVLVVPGGAELEPAEHGRRFHERHEPALRFVRDSADQANVTASVGTGAFILAAAGLLDGRRVNTHWQTRRSLAEFMAERGERVELVPERVVDDGNLLTSAGVTAGIDLALAIVDRYGGAKHCHATELLLELDTPEELEYRLHPH